MGVDFGEALKGSALTTQKRRQSLKNWQRRGEVAQVAAAPPPLG